MKDETLVSIASGMVDKAIVFNRDKSKAEGVYPCVGVAIVMKDDNVFTGFNVELHGYKGYHAEEIAVIASLKAGYKKNDFVAMAVVYNFAGDYPSCMWCRQLLHDIANDGLKIIAYSLVDKKGSAYTLADLIPKPYPDFAIKEDKRKNMV